MVKQPAVPSAGPGDVAAADLAGVIQRALEPAHLSLWTNDRG
jgi:hypothetical protein